MSKSSLSAFRSQVKAEQGAAWETDSKLESIGKQMFASMNDAVGQVAQGSIKGIKDSFSYNMNTGYKGFENMASAIERGYFSIDSHLTNAENIASRARAIKRELGDL